MPTSFSVLLINKIKSSWVNILVWIYDMSTLGTLELCTMIYASQFNGKTMHLHIHTHMYIHTCIYIYNPISLCNVLNIGVIWCSLDQFIDYNKSSFNE